MRTRRCYREWLRDLYADSSRYEQIWMRPVSRRIADVGGVATVTAVFTKAVSKLTTATLGSNTVVWTSTGAALQTWVGKWRH
ncbi:hypothetical protein O9993_15230 [Vibrio lentus]|nr:hypothetical protein [Vibrio lentus]